MRITLEKRKELSRPMLWLTPALAVALTMLTGAIIFTLIGYDGLAAVREIFISPLADPNRWQDLGIKAAPLIIIAVGLSFGFRANVWNIGAEGQYIMGALAGTGVALATWGMEGTWILPAMFLHGVVIVHLFAPFHESTHGTAFRSRWRERMDGDPSKARVYKDIGQGLASGTVGAVTLRPIARAGDVAPTRVG